MTSPAKKSARPMTSPTKKRLHLFGSTRGHDAGIYDEDVACIACASVVEKTLGMDRWPLPLIKNVPRHQEK